MPDLFIKLVRRINRVGAVNLFDLMTSHRRMSSGKPDALKRALMPSYVTAIAVLCLSTLVRAEGLQSYEAGSYSIRERLKTLHTITAAIEVRLKEPALPAKEKELRLACLQQYASEKTKLEADLESGRKVSESVFVMYLAQKSDPECTAGLDIPGLKHPITNFH